MLSCGSCDGHGFSLGALGAGRARELARQFSAESAGPPDEETLRRLARDFASIFYSVLVKQMQRTVGQDDEDADALSEGVRDFMGMFLPEVAAGSARDPLADYIYQQLSTQCGGRFDESA